MGRLAVFRTRRAPKWAGWVKGSATSGLKGSAAARDSSAANTASNPSYHIVESWDIEKMMEEPPTDYYYDRLSEDLRKRHPQADSHLIDHLVSLEAFLDKSILFGFFFGINKAEVAVAEGKLLGHKIGRSGSSPDEERCQAVGLVVGVFFWMADFFLGVGAGGLGWEVRGWGAGGLGGWGAGGAGAGLGSGLERRGFGRGAGLVGGAQKRRGTRRDEEFDVRSFWHPESHTCKTTSPRLKNQSKLVC